MRYCSLCTVLLVKCWTLWGERERGYLAMKVVSASYGHEFHINTTE